MTKKKNNNFNQKWIIAGISLVAIILIGVSLRGGVFNQSASNQESKILYHSPACPICLDVKAYISDNNITGIVQKNVEVNRAAANELRSKMIRCGEDISRGLSVPVLWADGQCFLGGPEIISYFENLNLNIPNE